MDSKIPAEFENEEEITQLKTEIKEEKEINTYIKYIKGNFIGKGGFSTCYKVFCTKDKQIYAAKEINNKSPKDRINNEINLYKSIHHENIVNLKEYFTYNGKHYLIFEFCENKDLFNLLKNRKSLKEIEVQYYMSQLIDAIIYLHKQKIIHRDIKLENIFLTEKMELKLGDFGLAEKLSNLGDKLYDKVGTINYMAPELLENKGYSFEVDIWAIGIIMYYLIIGRPPFNHINKEDIKNIDYKFPEDAIISKAAKDLIKKILVKDPKQRPNLYDIIQHDFFFLGRTIPRLIPKEFMYKPPSLNYIRNFMEDANENGIVDKKVFNNNFKFINISIEDTETNNYTKNESGIYVDDLFKFKNYGFGYRLNNNKFGVCFNDGSKIIHGLGENKFFYVKNKEEGNYYKKYEIKFSHDLNKKYKILKSFEEFLTMYQNNSDSSVSIIQNKTKKEDELNYIKPPIYVKKFYCFDEISILIKLSNKDIQVYFLNGENILLSKKEKEITFIKKDNDELEILTYPLEYIMLIKNEEIRDKIKYIKSLIKRVLVGIKKIF